MAAATTLRRSRGTSIGRPAVGFVSLWTAWIVFQLGYVWIRAIGDNLQRPHNPEPLEHALFRVDPGVWLQAHLGGWWLDFLGFLSHGFWFGLPFAMGLAIMLYRRELLFEYLVWTTVVSYICIAFFIALPADPPWMHVDVQRILEVRNFGGDYVALDNNPSAAFPSMHAALPAAMGLFFLIRWPRRPLYGYLCFFMAGAIGFSVVYLGEHWLVDVLAGYAVAGATAWLCLSERLLRLYDRLPGHPVTSARRLNRWFFAPAPVTAPSHEEPTALPRAA
jgi:membrane-associated phospholipid phosphatase